MELDKFIELVKEQQGIDLSGVLTTADKIGRPERALERQAIDDFMKRNPMAGGGMLVKPNADGSRPGYADKSGRETVHLVNVTGNPNHSGIYRTTNLNSGKITYRGGYTRKKEGGRKFTKSSPTIKGARADLDKALQIPKGKSIIDLQKERGAGNLLNDEKFINELENAFEEVSKLEKKGYGNIDKIVKKYQKKFYVKKGTKSITNMPVTTGKDNVFTKTLASEIREYAKDLEIYNLENPKIEKAIEAYKKIKNPVRGTYNKPGTLEIIAKKFGIEKNNFSSYLSKLGERNYIAIKDPDEYTKAIREAEKKALKKFSDRYFERVLSAPMTSGKYFADAADDEVVRLQKSHLGDKLTQDVKTSNIGYAAQEINQEVLKDIDLEMRKINKQLANLYKNKPAGYKEKMDILNRQGSDLAAVSKGYKKFEAIDPDTGKKFVINFSSPSQELDPSDLLKYDPNTNTYSKDTKLASIDKEDKALVRDLKKDAMQAATKTKAQVQADIDTIKKNLFDFTKGESQQVKGLAAYMKKINPDIVCNLSNGVNCNDPRAYQKSINEYTQKAAQGDKKAAAILKNFSSKAATAGKFIKAGLGPLAIATEAAIDLAVPLNTTLQEGIPFKQAFADTLINKYILGPKLQVDKEAEIAKEMAKGEEFAMAKRGERMMLPQSATADAQRLKKREEEMLEMYPNMKFANMSNEAIDAMLEDQGVYSPFTLGYGLQQKQPGIGDMKYNEELAYDQLREAANKKVNELMLENQMSNLAFGAANFEKGGRAGFKSGTLRKGILKLIDDSVKSTPKDTTTELDKLIKKTLDEDLFDKKDRIVDSINISEAKKRKNYPYNMRVFEEPKNLDFYRAIKESNFRTKTGPFFDRTKKAGGGLLKQAGDRSGPPPESGPNSQGLQGILNRVKKT